jgi:dolichyl-phosphate-mannose-protein mannosyltransferase
MPARAPGWPAVLAVAAVALAAQLPIYDRWVSFMDEGHILAFADILAKGGELYRDATLYPLPGAFYLLAGAFRTFGTSILVARGVVVVEFALFVAALFVVLRRLVSPRLALVGVALLLVYRIWAFPHWQMYSYSSTALCLIAVALVLCARFLVGGGTPWLAAAGVAAGLGLLCKQDYGVAMLLALNVVVLVAARTAGRSWWSSLLALDGPPLVLGTALVLHYARQGLLLEMLRQTVVGHVVGLATFDYPSFPPLWPLLRQDPVLRDTYGHVVWVPPIIYTVDWEPARASWLYRETALWDTALKLFFYGPYLLVAAGVVRLWSIRAALRDRARRDRALVELAVLAVALAALLVISVNKPRDYVHMAILYWPFLVLLVAYGEALGRRARVLGALVAIAALVVAVPFVRYTARLARGLAVQHQTPLAAARGGIRVKPAEARVLDDAVAWMQATADPSESVAVLPYFPVLSFLADRRGPHRSSYVVWPVPDHPDRDRQIIAAMEAERTPAVLYSVTQWPQFPRFEQYAKPIVDYLVERFETERVFSPDPWGYILLGLRRRTAPPAGQLLPVESGRVEVVGPDGARRPAAPETFAIARWPFRDVMAIQPQAGGGRRELVVPLAVPPGSRLTTAAGVHPARWVGFPALTVTFRVHVDGETVAERTLDPQRNVADRGWIPIDVPLERYAGRTVELGFSTAAERPEAEALEMGGFALPRLVTQPGGG